MAKENKKFMVLSAIGIIMVVDSHTWGTFNIFGNFFPFNSFFMPMFVFISGYFNKADKNTDLWKYTKRKFMTLLLPYLVVSVIALITEWLIMCYKTEAIQPFLMEYKLKALLNTFTSGEITTIALPMWFAPMLFAVQIVYALIKKVLSDHWNSGIALIPFIALHIFVVWYAKEHDELPEYLLLPLKVLFFLPFMEMGILYRDVLEEKLRKANHLLLLTVLLIINMVRIMILPNEYDVAFDSMATLSGFTSPYAVTPLLSSVVGILFWLTMVDILGRMFYDSRFVNFLSANTFWVMGFHIMFYSVLNCILMMINDCIIALPYFDEEAFRETEWYYWEISPNFKLAYLVIGVLGPLGLKYIYEKIKKKIEKEF